MTPNAFKDIELLRVNYLRGPNIWTYRPVMEVWLDLGELEDYPSNRIPGLNERLVRWLPALVEHHCGVGERGGFLQRLQEGTWAGHVLEHCVIELLNLAGMPTGFGQTRSTSRRGVYRMVFRARDEKIGRVALAEAQALLMAAIGDRPFDVPAAVDRLRQAIDDCYLGPSTASIVAAATDRRIPHIRLNDGNLVQLGHGARQRRIWTAETDLTGAIAEGIAGDKDLTKTLLKACGVPVPEGVVVRSADEAWAEAQDIGLPVVVKPSDGNHGRGVTLDLDNEADVRAAFDLARHHGSEVLVEQCIKGSEHRLLVVGGKVVAAARGESAWIVGDGRSTVTELIERQINADPRRGTTEAHPLNRLDLAEDDVIRLDLQRQGLRGDSIVEAGRRVLIQRNGNVANDCTDEVHPAVAAQAALAARVVGLDIAGIDLVCEDIARPLEAQGGAVVEVNAGPGLLMHLKPASGQPRPVGQAIVDHLFPEDDATHPGRIPIVGISGSRHTGLMARLVAWLVQLSGKEVGLACTEGLYVGRRRVDAAGASLWDAGHRMLMNRDIHAAVYEAPAAMILEDGLPYDRCLVGVVCDLDGWEVLRERHDLQERDQMFKVMRTQVDVVLREGVAVLNAADPCILDMAELSDGEVMLYGDADLPDAAAALDRHRAAGGRVAILQRGWICLASAGERQRCVDLAGWLARRGADGGDRDLHHALLGAVAAAWAAGVSPELISAGIETFDLLARP